MRGPDPFEGLERDLDYWSLPEDTVELEVSEEGPPLPGEERQLRFLVSTGLFDLLVEELWSRCEDGAERELELGRVLGRFQSIEPTLRFWLHEHGDQLRRTELMARMRGKDVAVTEHFLLPRLEHGLRLYEERARALRSELEGR